MKHGSEYAKRVKRLFQQLVRRYGKPAAVEPTDPLDQMLVSILAACTTNTKARTVFRRLRQQMVDLNELRVTPPMELADLIGPAVPRASEKAQRMVDLLNDIRRRQDALDLSFLKQRGRREAREYLESLQGADRAAAASVVLLSLGGHAIPVDDLTLYVLRKDEIVDGSAGAGEVQGFLERHVNAADARVFVELLNRHVASRGARVPIEQLDELLKPPPPPPPADSSPEALATAAQGGSSAATTKPDPAAKKPTARAAPAGNVEKKSKRTIKKKK